MEVNEILPMSGGGRKKNYNKQRKKITGIDGDIWDTHEKRYEGIKSLGEHTQNPKGYKALRMKRIWIPKAYGDKRPLGIPTMTNRAMQCVHYMATVPIVEIISDKKLLWLP